MTDLTGFSHSFALENQRGETPKIKINNIYSNGAFPVKPVKKIIMAERDIVAAILRLLKKQPECFSWKEHGGMYGTAGLPDIIACIHGRFVAFEVKTPTGKLTKLQEITIQKIRDAGGHAFKVTSAIEVSEILKKLEVTPYE